MFYLFYKNKKFLKATIKQFYTNQIFKNTFSLYKLNVRVQLSTNNLSILDKFVPWANTEFIQVRYLSRGLPKYEGKPLVLYKNAMMDKNRIFKENKEKSFIYRWKNNLNDKDYLGSTFNAKSRLRTYFDKKSLVLGNMPIYKALLKYGHSNFSFEILEYCKLEDLILREQFYLDHFDFDYNILEKADSSLGFKHSIEVIKNMKGRQNAKGFKHSADTIDYLRSKQLGMSHPASSLKKMRDSWSIRKLKIQNSLKNGEFEENNFSSPNFTNVLESRNGLNKVDVKHKRKLGKKIFVTNVTNNITDSYVSLTEAASVLNVTRSTLRSYLDKNKLLRILRIENEKVIQGRGQRISN